MVKVLRREKINVKKIKIEREIPKIFFLWNNVFKKYFFPFIIFMQIFKYLNSKKNYLDNISIASEIYIPELLLSLKSFKANLINVLVSFLEIFDDFLRFKKVLKFDMGK